MDEAFRCTGQSARHYIRMRTSPRRRRIPGSVTRAGSRRRSFRALLAVRLSSDQFGECSFGDGFRFWFCVDCCPASSAPAACLAYALWKVASFTPIPPRSRSAARIAGWVDATPIPHRAPICARRRARCRRAFDGDRACAGRSATRLDPEAPALHIRVRSRGGVRRTRDLARQPDQDICPHSGATPDPGKSPLINRGIASKDPIRDRFRH